MRWILIATTLGSCLWGQRYRTPMFNYDREVVLYAIVHRYDWSWVALDADLYIPREASPPLRPLIILVHGGGFLIGSRRDAWIVHLADYFARLGYVVASIDYRLGGEHGSPMHWLRANIHAVQDLRTFIRYMKYLVVNEGNPFSIDTTKIFVGGHSAGAFTSLCAAYLHTLEELAEIPQADTAAIRAQGGLRGEGYLMHTDNFALVFSLGGALYRLSWLSAKKVPALVTIHAIDDNIVLYGFDSGHYNLGWAGAQPLDSAAKVKGIRTWHLAFPAGGHEPWGNRAIVGWAMPQAQEFLAQVFYEEQRRLNRPVEPMAIPRSPKQEANMPLSQRTANPEGFSESFSLSMRWVAYDGLGQAFGEVERLEELPPGVWTLWNPITSERRKVYRMP